MSILALPQTAKKLFITDADFVSGAYTINDSHYNTYVFSITQDYNIFLGPDIDPNILLTLKIGSNPGSHVLNIYNDSTFLSQLAGTQYTTFTQLNTWVSISAGNGTVTSIQPIGALAGIPPVITESGTIDMVTIGSNTTTNPYSLDYDTYGRVTSSTNRAYFSGNYYYVGGGTNVPTSVSFTKLPFSTFFTQTASTSEYTYNNGQSTITYNGPTREVNIRLSIGIGTDSPSASFCIAINGVQDAYNLNLFLSGTQVLTSGTIDIIKGLSNGSVIAIYYKAAVAFTPDFTLTILDI